MVRVSANTPERFVMTIKQYMLDGSLVPVAPHRDSLVVCVDGEECRYEDVVFDCEGGYHCEEESARERHAEILQEALDAEDAYCIDYVASEDYGNDYAYLPFENPHRIREQLEEYVRDEYADYYGTVRNITVVGIKLIVDGIYERVDCNDVEARYNYNEYSNCFGEGCLIDSLGVGEHETQIDINAHKDLKRLYDHVGPDGFADLLKEYNGDLYVSHREADDLRKHTDYPCFFATSGGHGCWGYVVPESRMKELIAEACIDYCRKADGK